jgi:PKD repeat protein
VDGTPKVWLSTTAANPDGATEHFRRTDRPGGWVEYATEDMTGGGDSDFNDLVFRLGPASDKPAVRWVAPLAGAEGGEVALTAVITDPNPTATHTVSIAWGDGATSDATVALVAGEWRATGAHTYADNKDYPVNLTVTNSLGLTGTRAATAAVANADPTLAPAADRSAKVGEALALELGTFSDPGFTSVEAGTTESFTATVNWGDGSGDQPADVSATNGEEGTPTTGSVSGGHTYTVAGNYTVTLTVTDDDGGKATGTFAVRVASAGPRFFVADESAHATFGYAADGKFLGSHPHAKYNSRPRGIAANASGDTLWVVEAGGDVFVYEAGGKPLGQWSAGGTYQPQDVATDGTHVWLVDDAKDRVLFYPNAASRRDGSQTTTGGFALDKTNGNPSGLVVRDGQAWVTDDRPDSENDRVFVYSLGGKLLGQWQLDPANAHSSGVTLDPNGGTDLWVVDRQDSRVYHYAGGTEWVDGARTAADSFALAPANHHAEGIADPPPDGWHPAPRRPRPTRTRV